jgi:molecular chaperone IbpA
MPQFKTPYPIWNIEFESAIKDIESALNAYSPPVNHSEDDNNVYVEMALAGYSRDKIKVYTKERQLFIEVAKESTPDNRKYQIHNISRKAFTWRRPISEKLKVKTVKFENGLLEIVLEKVVPEAQQRKDYL